MIEHWREFIPLVKENQGKGVRRISDHDVMNELLLRGEKMIGEKASQESQGNV